MLTSLILDELKTFLRYFGFTIELLFLLVCTLLILLPNSISQFLDSTIAFSLQQSSDYASNSIIFSSTPNSTSLSSPSTTNNDTILALEGPTLIDGTGNPP